MNKRYYVQIPLTAVVGVEVEATNEKEALEVAFESTTLHDVVEWDLHEKICEGNVFHGLINRYEIEEIE